MPVGFARNGVYVALNTGTSFGAGERWHSSFGSDPEAGSWTDNNKVPRYLVDVNGDGLSDVLGFARNGVYVALENGRAAPDHMTAITNGTGAQIAITHTPLTKSSVYAKGPATVHPLRDITGPIYVVSRVDTSSGIGNPLSTTYRYAGTRADLRGRGFLGFQQMTVTDLQTGIAQTVTYRQDFPLVGLAASQSKKLGSVALNQVTNTYQHANASGGITVAPGNAPYRVFLTQSVASSADLNGSALPSTTSTYQYDTAGNATAITVSASDGHTKTTTNTYNNDTTNWLLGRLTRASVKSTLP